MGMSRDQREAVQHVMGVLDMLAGMRGVEITDGMAGVIIGELEALQAVLDTGSERTAGMRETMERVTCDADG